jgi:hypothetical protein
MDEEVRDMLRRKAENVPPHREVPASLAGRARRRIALNALGASAIVLVLVAGAFTGFRAFAGATSRQPAGEPTVVHPQPSSSPTPSTIVSSPSPTPSPSPSSAGATTPARCKLGDLKVAVAGTNGAAGHIQVEVSMRNHSSAACSLEGYPGMLLLAGTNPLHTDVVRGSSVVVPPIRVRLVVLQPGARAAYVFGYSDVPTGNQSCPNSTALEVTPPNAFAHATISLNATACGGVLTTSPVFLGLHVPSS